MIGQPGTGRDQTADNDILLKATQLITLAHDSRFGKYTVVSWKDAAEIKELVDKLALVIPKSTNSDNLQGPYPLQSAIILIQNLITLRLLFFYKP
jgi:hypothetical protein